MTLGITEWLLLTGAIALALVGAVAALVTWAVLRTGDLQQGEESPLGWIRSGLAFGALALLPVWGLMTVFVLYAEYDMEVTLFWRAGLVSLVLVLEAGGVIAALLLATRGTGRLLGLIRARSVKRRYAEVVGDGGVLRADAWEPDVLEGGEE